MDINKIKPKKNHCYENCIKFLEVNPTWDLVHAIAIGTGPENNGLEFGHAWCEKDGLAYDPSKDVLAPAFLVRRIGQVKYSVVYSYDQAMKNMDVMDTYGPWDETISKSLHGEDVYEKKYEKN